MNLFQYNRPDIIGYSVCCNPAPIMLHAHTSKDDDLSFYQSAPRHSVWVYVPLEQDEKIESIWMRARSRLNLEVALVFHTDKGRTHLLGAQAKSALLACPWILLDRPNGEPGHLFFDRKPFGISLLGLSSKTPEQVPMPALPEPLSSNPQQFSMEGMHWSKASVEDVVAVSCCRPTARAYSDIIGLVFYYSDGRKACVGQIRLDCLGSPLVVNSSHNIYLGFKTTDMECPYIARVEMSSNVVDDTVRMWLEVSWKGSIEWWYSSRQCQVWHNGRRSLVTRP